MRNTHRNSNSTPGPSCLSGIGYGSTPSFSVFLTSVIAYKSFMSVRSCAKDAESCKIPLTDQRMDCAVCCRIAIELKEMLAGAEKDLSAKRIYEVGEQRKERKEELKTYEGKFGA